MGKRFKRKKKKTKKNPERKRKRGVPQPSGNLMDSLAWLADQGRKLT
jgi:hypothetical protein